MSSAFYIPTVNFMGAGCLTQAADAIKSHGFKKALIVTDKVLNQIGVVTQVAVLLTERDIDSVVYDGTQPNPTIKNVDEGLALLKENQCDFVISLGGGSPHDCAKGIALLAANGGQIGDYEGVDRSAKAQLPVVAINTTAGTASEMTRFCIITDEERHIKMAIVDKNTTPLMSVNDPQLMLAKPASLTAATGMDALTHAIEAYVSTAATPITDAVAIKAIELIQQNLRTAVKEGQNLNAREQMAYAQFMAGMAFNNASLGYVHAMAHQLGGYYNLPHGVCNAVLLPHVQRYNAQVSAERLRDVAKAMGVDVEGMTAEQGADAALEAIVALSKDVGIPSGLKELGAKEEDIALLADNALKDACGFTNPKQATHEEISQIFMAAM
ncbi:L-threonine dehydrogenase [Photobacterium leiognathi]|uniref:L-threonine dehydrogenase n=1 Tax=Photobacterium leiognathi subsp. mandapamensis TaxID=48408 RepID=A0A2T3KZY0_PHOLD|nr:L-threonine dehydrogenase [Photobacterium leiognathi]MCG3885851.1 L-threonine dehydrogenase [Photobacterium leiognathi]PSV13665.1 L-threonine dehydrogenase [Photobacterium leiognathi subsp. mandapamensis]PSW43775.1 L-threonine dehydrogenase [Photobacterium leiognathi subsp. mandapamensis]PSW54278.1 L-threonine dehydrogenase [Photobacterium leiognathi subsp. mandapamensis]PSW59158.1 L-threonine dehydrogenase [Photobacterium leiognathi subsp. mandapamensis]